MRSFCTICTRSFLKYALALRESLTASGNEETLYVLVLDAGERELTDGEDVAFLTLDQLGDAGPEKMRWYFDVFELCNAMKCFLVKHLLELHQDTVIYLDADIMVNGSLSCFWNASPEKALLVTPHHLQPIPLEIRYSTEEHVADMGFINGGFAVWRPGTEAGRMLDWLCSRIPCYGFNDRKKAMYSDQKLLPLLLQYFPDHIGILRDPGLNVGFWNVHERRVGNGPNEICPEEILFYHLSGYRPDKPETPCVYHSSVSNRAILEQAPWFPTVLRRYGELLGRQVPPECSGAYPYNRWGRFTLSPDLRRILAAKGNLTLGDRDVLRALFTDWLRRVKRYFLPYREK